MMALPRKKDVSLRLQIVYNLPLVKQLLSPEHWNQIHTHVAGTIELFQQILVFIRNQRELVGQECVIAQRDTRLLERCLLFLVIYFSNLIIPHSSPPSSPHRAYSAAAVRGCSVHYVKHTFQTHHRKLVASPTIACIHRTASIVPRDTSLSYLSLPYDHVPVRTEFPRNHAFRRRREHETPSFVRQIHAHRLSWTP